MIELVEFSLQTTGPFPLLRNGNPVPMHIEGDVLRRQFETAHGYLFITDHDCPFEETTHLTRCRP